MTLKRRSVLIAGAAGPLAAAGVLSPSAAVAAPVAPPVTPQPLDGHGARTVDFGQGWRFALANPTGITDPTGQYATAADPGLDDSGWRTVSVPHDWSIELAPVQAPDTSGGTGYFHGGLGWYRKTFTLPASMAGKRISIEFDGVYMDSYVYLGGTLLGNHPYGYTGFSLDLTGKVHTDGVTPNVIAVKVQNQLPSSRWYSGSGIYRNVRLVVTDPVHVRRWGTFVTTPEVSDGRATVQVRTDIANDSGASAQVRTVSTVLDATGRPVGRAATTATVEPAGHTDTVTIPVPDPKLWSIERPYLYTLRTDLVVRGRTVDTYLTTFGIRYFRMDPDEGFSLNGKHLKIQGVDLHHDQGALGSAIHVDAVLRQMKIMKSMGVNAFRTSHNPPSPEMIRVCEQLGIVLMVEAFDCWRRGKNPYDYGRFFDANSDADITEMVHAAKNSPAVIMWSIGNEIPDSTSTAGLAMAQRLIDDVRAVDGTRPVVIGSDKYRGLPKPGSPADLMLAKLDGLGLNYNTAASVDALHAGYPHLFLFESESSSETSTRGVYQEPEHLNTGENHTPGRRGTSSYDNNLASWTISGEYGLKKDRDRRFFAGQFLWSGVDYIGEPTPYDVFPVKASFFGAVDTAGFPKDQYYLFQSRWTSAPMVHLLPMNWTDHEPGEIVEVRAYSNVDTVELLLNGASLGVRTFDRKTTGYGASYLETTEATHDDKTVTTGPYPGSYTSPNGSAGKLHLTWRVPFAPGTLTAIARRGGVEVARDELRTAGPAAAVRLTPDRKVVAADGRSLAYLTVDIVDAHGVLVPGAQDAVTFQVSGGTLAGLDNGRQESAESYQGTTTRRAWAGKALAIIRSTARPGPITVTATAAGLLPGGVTLYATDGAGHQLIGLDPVRLRIPLGESPRLPGTVPAIYADGSQRPLPVRWDGPPAQLRHRAGSYQIQGSGAGAGPRALAIVTVYAPAAVETYSTVVPVGTAPSLPATVRLVHTDGVEQRQPVAWIPVPPARYAAAGQFTIAGTVAGATLPAQATIRVTDGVTRAANLAASAGPLHAAADASYSGAPGTLPAAMLDGVTDSGGWSNAFSKAPTALLPVFNTARPADWVSVSWPNPQRFGSVTAYFGTDARHTLPASVAVTYWNGTALVPVRGLAVAWSGTVATITFEPVATTQLRLDLTSAFPGATNGFLQIAELTVTGDAVVYNSTAALAELTVDGRPVPGFDPGTTSYSVTAGRGTPVIGARAADNGRLVIVPPPALPGTAQVTVTAEDGLTQRAYTIQVAVARGGPW
jgi:beta-galactosidase